MRSQGGGSSVFVPGTAIPVESNIDKKLEELESFLKSLRTRAAWPVLCLFSVPANLFSLPFASNLKAAGWIDSAAVGEFKKYGAFAGAFFVLSSFVTTLVDLIKKCNAMLEDVKAIREMLNEIKSSKMSDDEKNNILKNVAEKLSLPCLRIRIMNYFRNNFGVVANALFALFTGFVTASFFMLNELYSKQVPGFATPQFSDSYMPMLCWGLMTGLLSAAAVIKNGFDFASLNALQGKLGALKASLGVVSASLDRELPTSSVAGGVFRTRSVNGDERDETRPLLPNGSIHSNTSN